MAPAPRQLGALLPTLERDDVRAWMCVDWLVRVRLPAWLALAGLTRRARAVRRLPPIRDTAAAEAAVPTLAAARRACEPVPAREAAWDALWSVRSEVASAAARAAALRVTAKPGWAAVREGAHFAPWGAARDAIGDTVWNATLTVALDAAWEAGEDTARAVAERALAPTAAALERSAEDLLKRLGDPRRLDAGC